MTATELPGRVDLSEHGIDAAGRVYRNPTTSLLYTHALAARRRAARRGRAARRRHGQVHRAARRRTSSSSRAGVRGPDLVGRRQPAALARSTSTACARRSTAQLGRPTRSTSSTPSRAPTRRTGIGVRVITAHPYHALFAKTMFIDLTPDELRGFEPQALVLHAPDVEADPDEDGTRTGTFVVLHPGRTELLVGGTFYAGEIKKSIFTVMNDRLPLEGVFPMHCSANVGDDGRVAVFFGLSGTGKTTLSADPERSLIGDDEHGWGDTGVFNIEGGCYAKVIRLSRDGRAGDLPDDAHLRDDPRERRDRRARRRSTSTTTRRPRTRAPRTSSSRSRTRCPRSGPAIPRRSIFLTADAFGILPPIARLSRDQALYYFLSGFTAKLAGTEIGVTEPQPTFSTCFGAAVPAAAARGLRADARREARRARLERLARQHGLDRRAVRRGPADADPRRRARCCTPRSPASSTASSSAPTTSSASRCRSRCPASTRRCSTRARPGATRTRTTARRASSPAMFVDNFATAVRRRRASSIRAAGPTPCSRTCRADRARAAAGHG